MAAPQDPPRRQWQKKRRTKKLAEWRAKKAAAGETTAPVAKVAETAKKAAPAKAAKPAAAAAPAKKTAAKPTAK